MPERVAKSNEEKGEASFRAGGRTYKLKYDYNALALVEQNTGESVKGVSDIVDELQQRKVSVTFMRALLYGGLRGGGHNITLEEVGDLMGTIKEEEKLEDVITKAGKAFSFSLAPDEEAQREMKQRMEEQKEAERPTENP